MNADSNNSIMNTYARLPISIVEGDGAWLIDSTGKRYLDAISGIAVCNLGHSHAGLTKAISEQAATLIHTSNLYKLPLQEKLAATLCKASGMETVFFCNSGAESNEAAIKLARRHAHNKGNHEPVIIVTNGAFHGRTLGALSATHSEKYQQGFGPLPAGFERIPYDDIDALKACLQEKNNVAAVMLEPIQGEGGVILPSANYLQAVRNLCDEHQVLMILDEVQSGNGRTGEYFAYQHAGILPDVITTAKGLGNGFPIGATLAQGEAAKVFEPGHHATTFGGSPLACAAALAVYTALEEEKLLDNAKEKGLMILEGLRSRLEHLPWVNEVRGKGMMIGVDLSRPCAELLTTAREKGLLINIAADNVVRLLPALNTTEDEAELIITIVSDIISDLKPE